MPNISIKIDVTRITKERLYKGAKGTYLNAIMIEKVTDYGDYMIVEDVPKAERLKGIKGNILGNGKILEKVRTVGAAQKPESNPENSDDVPF